jgi:hypothetical protein
MVPRGEVGLIFANMGPGGPRRSSPLWLESLIVAVRTCDPHFDAVTEKTWKEAMQPGIDYIVSFY